MKNIKKSLTRDDVIKNGEYIGFTEYESGATEQRWLIDGLGIKLKSQTKRREP